MIKSYRNTPAPLEACALIALCFGWFIFLSLEAVALGFPAGGEFSDANLIGLIVMECALGALALLLLRWRGYAIWHVLPTPTWRGCASGALLCAAAWLAWAVVSQFFASADLQAQPITRMVAQSKPSVAVVVALAMINGLYEETFLVGYLVRGFAALGASLAIGASLLVRVLYHLYQGPIGAVSVLVFGLVVSAYYWRTRTLWPVVVAHTMADAVAFA